MERSPEYGVLVGLGCCRAAGACAQTIPAPNIIANPTATARTRQIIISQASANAPTQRKPTVHPTKNTRGVQDPTNWRPSGVRTHLPFLLQSIATSMSPSRRLFLQSLTVALVAALAAFLALTVLHAALPRLAPLDVGVQSAVHAWTSPALTNLMRALTFIGSIEVFIPTLIAAVAVLLLIGQKEQGVRLVRKRQVSTLFAIGIGGALILNGTFKTHFHRARPRVPWSIGDEHTFSFPSGHSLFSFVLYGLIAYSVLTRRDPLLRRLLVTLGCAALALGIGISRIYLGMHWPTDVLAGYLTAAIWLTATITIDRRWRAEFARSRAGLGQHPPVALN